MKDHTFNIAIAALGGEGGGVLVGWILEAAQREGWHVQSTSVPGVAQRTGSTIYYIEMFPREGHGRAPVMSLFPFPGDVDLVMASELVEAGRMALRGLITPERTSVIASSHRIYSVKEKSASGDGRSDSRAIAKSVEARSRDFLCLDLREVADRHGTPISAALCGALAGSGLLPLQSDTLEDVVRSSGKRPTQNLAAFAEAMEQAREGVGSRIDERQEAPAPSTPSSTWRMPEATTKGGEGLLERLREEFPEQAHEVLWHGLGQLVDYQDFRYAHEYLDRLRPLVAKDNGEQDFTLLNEAGRHLALWMTYEDIVRVAQLKTRSGRFSEIRDEVRAAAGQPMHVTEYFAPRLEEFCALMPVSIATRLLNSRFWQALFGSLTKGLLMRSDRAGPFLLLRLLAGLRRWRRSTWGFQQESRQLDDWLERILNAQSYALSLEIAKCGRLVKGYGETRQRGFGRLHEIFESANSAEQVRTMRERALANV